MLCAKVEASQEAAAGQALSRAASFFTTQVAFSGSYVWSYSLDLQSRSGEGVATASQGWAQEPGTPSVGIAFLQAYDATGDVVYLEAAKAAAHALAVTQLGSGGWHYRMEFDPAQRRHWFYRTDVEAGDDVLGTRNNKTLYDDDNTQLALRFLMRVDSATSGADAQVRRAVTYGLSKILRAQYPIGGWPALYEDEDLNAAPYPVRQARYPATVALTYPGASYTYVKFYSLQDAAIPDLISTLLLAYHLYGNAEYLAAARSGGDFLVRAQMPAPQTAWAQQYDFQVEPAWGRKFEPPAIASRESAEAVRVLVDLYLATGNTAYLSCAQRGAAWLRSVRSADGQWPRFSELRTNRPLYVDANFQVGYTSDNLLPGYGFEGVWGISRAMAYCDRVARFGKATYLAKRARPRTASDYQAVAAALEPRVGAIVASLDAQGRWVENNLISTLIFNENVFTLATYIAACQGRDLKYAADTYEMDVVWNPLTR